MSKVTWEMFSKRRRTTLKSLYELGNVKSYKDFLDYCSHYSIEPIAESVYREFLKTMGAAPMQKIKAAKLEDDLCCGGRHAPGEHDSRSAETSQIEQLQSAAQKRQPPKRKPKTQDHDTTASESVSPADQEEK